MRKTLRRPLIAALLSGFTLFGLGGCSVENVGPPGPPGPAGNANVFSIGLRYEMIDAVINGTVASVQYDIPALSPLVVDEGAVLLFFRDQGTWTAMPYTFGVESFDLPAVDYTVAFGFGYEVGFLEVFYEVSTTAVEISSLPDRDIKMVVIDGFPYGKNSIDLTDWETVKTVYGLED